MRRGLSMNRRSQSTPTTRRQSPAWLSIISWSTSLDTAIPGPTTTPKYSVRQTERSRSRRITTYRTTRKALTCRRRAVMTRASVAANAGLAVNPNRPGFHVTRASAEISLGHFDEAKSDVQQAIRLSPRDPLMTVLQTQLGDIEIGSGRPEAAIVEYRKVARRGRSQLLELRKPRGFLCAFGQNGRGEAVRGRNPSRQSELHHQMVSRARGGHSEAYRRPAQGGVCGGMSALIAQSTGPDYRPVALFTTRYAMCALRRNRSNSARRLRVRFLPLDARCVYRKRVISKRWFAHATKLSAVAAKVAACGSRCSPVQLFFPVACCQ